MDLKEKQEKITEMRRKVERAATIERRVDALKLLENRVLETQDTDLTITARNTNVVISDHKMFASLLRHEISKLSFEYDTLV